MRLSTYMESSGERLKPRSGEEVSPLRGLTG
jgi:hypothetical protein